MAPRDVKKSAQGRPGARRGHQNRRQIVLGCEKIKFLSRGLSAKHGGSDFSSNFVDFRRFPEIRKPCSVRPWPHGTGFGTCQKQSSRLREVTSKNDENCTQNRLGVSEISEIAGSSGTSRRDSPGGSLREVASGTDPPGENLREGSSARDPPGGSLQGISGPHKPP